SKPFVVSATAGSSRTMNGTGRTVGKFALRPAQGDRDGEPSVSTPCAALRTGFDKLRANGGGRSSVEFKAVRGERDRREQSNHERHGPYGAFFDRLATTPFPGYASVNALKFKQESRPHGRNDFPARAAAAAVGRQLRRPPRGVRHGAAHDAQLPALGMRRVDSAALRLPDFPTRQR